MTYVPFVLLCLLVAAKALADEDISHHVLIIAGSPDEMLTPGTVPAQTKEPASMLPPSHGSIYASVWRSPEQNFVDSELGPLPLWSEVVYDGRGQPQPRFPDVFTKGFLDNPSPATALLYLEAQRVKARRYLQASQIMQQTAVAFGFVTPEAFRPPQAALSNDRALNPPYALSPENWGVPILDPQQARVVGLDPSDIPATPGRTTTRRVEILFFWDHRCAYSLRAFRALADFGTEVFRRELGPRVVTVSLDNDPVATRTQLDFLQWNGVETRYIENWLDQTELQTSLHIRVTPTYVFLDRRSGRIRRYEGVQDLSFLRAALLDLVGHQDATWEEVNPAWFRPVQRAAGSVRAAQDSADASGQDPPLESTPVQPPTRSIKSWDPDGQAER